MPVVVLTAVAIAALVGACASGSHSANSPASSESSSPAGSLGTTIVIKNFAFTPADLTVNPGAALTVRNEDPTTHTVTATSPHDKVFDTGNIAGGATVTLTAPKATGSYSYICMIHQFMHGTLTVK